MTISQGDYRDYDHDRMIVRFTLMDGDVEVPCSVSTAAMDDLDHAKGTSSAQRDSSRSSCFFPSGVRR